MRLVEVFVLVLWIHLGFRGILASVFWLKPFLSVNIFICYSRFIILSPTCVEFSGFHPKHVFQLVLQPLCTSVIVLTVLSEISFDVSCCSCISFVAESETGSIMLVVGQKSFPLILNQLTQLFLTFISLFIFFFTVCTSNWQFLLGIILLSIVAILTPISHMGIIILVILILVLHIVPNLMLLVPLMLPIHLLGVFVSICLRNVELTMTLWRGYKITVVLRHQFIGKSSFIVRI